MSLFKETFAARIVPQMTRLFSDTRIFLYHPPIGIDAISYEDVLYSPIKRLEEFESIGNLGSVSSTLAAETMRVTVRPKASAGEIVDSGTVEIDGELWSIDSIPLADEIAIVLDLKREPIKRQPKAVPHR